MVNNAGVHSMLFEKLNPDKALQAHFFGCQNTFFLAFSVQIMNIPLKCSINERICQAKSAGNVILFRNIPSRTFIFSLSPPEVPGLFVILFWNDINGGIKMSMTNRILLSIGILALDLVVFFLPLTALFIIYILLYNPPWFREFLNNLD